MKTKKILALILAVSMVAVMFAACADEGDDKPKYTRPEDEGGNSVDDDFPYANYDNQDFTFLVIKHSDTIKDYYGGPYIDADSYTGSAISDAVHERNLAVAEKYRVNVKAREEVNGEPAALLQTLYQSGDFAYDVIYGWGYKLGKCITENYFTDFGSLNNVDLTKEYWSPSAMEDLTIAGKQYLSINDISMNKLDWAGFLFYNKQLLEDYNVENEIGASVYDLVRDGKWTLDTFLKMVQSVSNDLDGDGAITKNDVFGLIDGDGMGTFASSASGIFNTVKNDDDTYTISLYDEKVLNIAEKIRSVYNNNKFVKDYDEIWEGADASGYSDMWEYARSFFATNHALFTTGSAYITSEFREMESPYGILPYPKYDENQEQYYSEVSSLASIFAIPSTVRTDMSTASFDRTGMILEYMAAKSNEILLPKYYEEVLHKQRLDSTEDREMMEIIRNSIRYEFTDMMGMESFADTKSKIYEKPNTAQSTYTRAQRKMEKELNDFYAGVLEMIAKNNAKDQ